MTNILSIPVKGNKKLELLLDLIEKDVELKTLWKCSNVLAIDRLGLSDHGPIHMKIVANGALKMLRLLVEKDIEPSIVTNFGMSIEDAEVVVVLASVMHDLGMAFVRESHEIYSVPLAYGILNRCLPEIYSTDKVTIISSEVAHAIVSHHAPNQPITIEAGVVKVADALDMEQGRARIPFEAGSMNIHSVSAISIDSVKIRNGEDKPIAILIEMSNPAGIFQVDNLLGAKIKGSGIDDYIQVEVLIQEGKDQRKIHLEL